MFLFILNSYLFLFLMMICFTKKKYNPSHSARNIRWSPWLRNNIPSRLQEHDAINIQTICVDTWCFTAEWTIVTRDISFTLQIYVKFVMFNNVRWVVYKLWCSCGSEEYVLLIPGSFRLFSCRFLWWAWFMDIIWLLAKVIYIGKWDTSSHRKGLSKILFFKSSN